MKRNSASKPHKGLQRESSGVEAKKCFCLASTPCFFCGTVTGERIEGSVEGKKSAQGYRVKTDLSKGGKKALQVDSKVKADPSQKSYSTKTVYSVMGGIIQGTIVLKYEGGVLTFSNVDKNTKDKIEF